MIPSQNWGHFNGYEPVIRNAGCSAQGSRVPKGNIQRYHVSSPGHNPRGFRAFPAPLLHHSLLFPDGLLWPCFFSFNLESLLLMNFLPPTWPGLCLSSVGCWLTRYLNPTEAGKPRSSCFKPQAM